MAVDEAMIPFKGRLGFKQYMKDKPSKWGIKVFVIADSISGCVYRLHVYTGKNSELAASEFGLCTRVVLDLVRGIESRSPKLYMDNYYTSPICFESYIRNR